MRLPWGIYYREPHNSCCALAYQLLCARPSAVVRSSSTCCAVSFTYRNASVFSGRISVFTYPPSTILGIRYRIS